MNRFQLKITHKTYNQRQFLLGHEPTTQHWSSFSSQIERERNLIDFVVLKAKAK